MMNQRALVFGILFIVVLFVLSSIAHSAPIPIPKINIGIEEAKDPKEVSLAFQILFLLTILTLVPSLLLMFTSFIRLSIVFMFVRQALATQQMPPQQVIIALALFLTLFIMAPTLSEVNKRAIQPYMNKEIGFSEALKEAENSFRDFMFRQTRERDISLFVSINKLPRPETKSDIPTFVLVPAFMISEMTTAFEMGVLLFVPFLVIDMVVASVLMSMGMIMLPPVMVSMPFKILLFVLVDGWHLLARSVILSFR